MITDKLNQAEKAAVDVMVTFTPWLAPIPSAWLIFNATHSHLLWPLFVAAVAGVAIECIGVASVVQALRAWEWNATKTKLDSVAPFKLCVALVLVYFVATIGLTVLLDVYPELRRFAPAVFPLLAAVGAINIAIKNGQQRREATAAQRKGNKRNVATQRNATDTQQSRNGKATAKQRMAQHWQPGIGATELANLAGVHKSTASRYINNGAAEHYREAA